MSDLQAAIDKYDRTGSAYGNVGILVDAARRVANLDTDALRKFINGYGIYPHDMGKFVNGITAALGITEDA